MKIKRIREESENVRTFFLDKKFPAEPGQYLMVWIHGVDEIPMSFSYPNAFTAKKVGEATSALFNLREGDRIGVRGPYGKCFIRKGRRVALIAGGIGAAPLAFLAEKSIKPTTFLGAKSREQLLFSRRFKKAGKLFLATEDGSSGYHGMVTDLLGSNLKKFDQIYVCGPEQMILKVLKICRNLRIEKRVQALVERYIKCAYGICGSCDLGGYKVCTDGPVFRGDFLVRTELGRFRRESSGRLLSLEKL